MSDKNTGSTQPKFGLTAFNCPSCAAFAEQVWEDVFVERERYYKEEKNVDMATCRNCGRKSLWLNESIVYPTQLPAMVAHPDMPDGIRQDYEEARLVASCSPRSAAALLRLCIQKLCVELGQSGSNINSDIAALVVNGLPVKIQRALDIVRVVGNEQVHPGLLDLRNEPDITGALFGLVNMIIENQIAEPKSIEELYTRLPASKREGISKRDADAQASNQNA